MHIDALLQAKPSEQIIKATPWLDGSAERIDSAHAEMLTFYASALERFIEVLGPPDEDSKSNAALAQALYYEALQLSAWRHEAGWIYLACVHHDRETPVFVACGYRETEAG